MSDIILPLSSMTWKACFTLLTILLLRPGGLQPEDSTAASGKSTQTHETPAKRQKLGSGLSQIPVPMQPAVIAPVQKPLSIPQTTDAGRCRLKSQVIKLRLSARSTNIEIVGENASNLSVQMILS